MQTRHRIPTVFSIYMLDVLCCALGCVILLWQVNHQEAEQQTAAAKEAEERWKTASLAVASVTGEADALKQALLLARQKFDTVHSDLDRTRADRDEARRLVMLREQEYEKLRQAWQLSEVLLKNVRGDLAKLKDDHKLTATQLADKIRANSELLLQVTAAEKKIGSLEKDVAARQLDATEAAKRLQDQLARLARADSRNADLEKQLSALRGEGTQTLTKLTLSEQRLLALEQELLRNRKALEANGDRNKDLQQAHDRLNLQLLASARDLTTAKDAVRALEGEKTRLLDRTRTLQAEAEQRFAGVTLTGKRVLFLVDMSGSMEMIDGETLDPDKWPLVCETVAQLLRSIKGLEHYQVILFSDRVRYPLGGQRTWLPYDAAKTPKEVAAALKAVKPEGETNMYDAFDEAFRYRTGGLDTMYVLSDGLPTAGAGLPAGATVSDAAKTDVLSKYLRGKLKNDWNRPAADGRRVRINTIGYFFESPDVGAFLWALAREHDGSFVGMSGP